MLEKLFAPRRFMKLYSKSYLVLLFYFLIICVTSYIGATMKGFRGFDYGLVIGLVISVSLWFTIGRRYAFGSDAIY